MGPKKDAKNIIEQAPKEPQREIPPHQLTGFGRFEYLSGVIYEGNWKIINETKKKQGYGILTISNSSQTQTGKEYYEGNWESDNMQGYGTYYYADGSVYRGDWKDNKHNGSGVLECSNGTYYDGQWRNHQMHGSGVFVDHLGRKWSGEFRDGLFSSRDQVQLINQKATIERQQEIKKQVFETVQIMLGLTEKGDETSFKDSFAYYFVQSDDAKHLVDPPHCKLSDKSAQKWKQLLNSAKNGKANIINRPQDSKAIKPQRIRSRQGQGEGQIVEIVCSHQNQSTSLSFLQVHQKRWILIFINEAAP